MLSTLIEALAESGLAAADRKSVLASKHSNPPAGKRIKHTIPQ